MDCSEGFDDPDACREVRLKIRYYDRRKGAAKRGRIGVEKVLSLCKVFLMQSAYFASMMLRWTSRKNELELNVADAAETVAVEKVLRLLYGARLSDAEDVAALVEMYAAADMLIVPQAIQDAILEALCHGVERARPPTLGALLDLCFGRPSLDRLFGLTVKRVVEALGAGDETECLFKVFGDVPSVVSSRSLREQFVSLPFEVVFRWACSDCLEVHSENCVLLLLSCWVRRQAVRPAKDLLDRLAGAVRPEHLSFTYLQKSFLFQDGFEWFVDSFEDFDLMLSWANLFALSTKEIKYHPGTPIRKARAPRTAIDCRELRLEWDVGLDDLFASPSSYVTSETDVYVNGLFWNLEAEVNNVNNSSFSVGVYLGPSCVHEDVFPFWDLDPSVASLRSFRIGVMKARAGPIGQELWHEKRYTNVVVPLTDLYGGNVVNLSAGSVEALRRKLEEEVVVTETKKMRIRVVDMSFS